MRNLLLRSIYRILDGDGEDPNDPEDDGPGNDDYEFDVDGDDTEMPDTNDFFTNSPTTAPVADTTTDRTFGVMLLMAGGAIGVYGLWRYYQYWSYRRERHLLEVQSERADAVLGDMQMVPADDDYATDDEEDPELL